MLQQENPDDYVIATGESHSVREVLTLALNLAGLNEDLSRYVDFDPKFTRPTEVMHLLGDSSKARRVLGWEPKKSFNDLVGLMLENDLNQEAKQND